MLFCLQEYNRTSNQSNYSSLPPMMAIGYSFSSQKLSLLSTEYQDDPTLKLLFSIAKEQRLNKVSVKKLTSEVCNLEKS